MPVAEALSVGTPAICSNISPLQEVGADVPDYLDPLDGPGWGATILDYAMQGPGHRAQLARIPHWRAPSWEQHIEIVTKAIARLQNT